MPTVTPAGGTDRISPESRPALSSAASDAAGILAVSAFHYLIAFVASAVLSRALGPEGRGVYYLPILAAITVLSFCKLGVDQANVYLMGTARMPLSRLSGQNGFIALVMGGLGCLTTAGLHWIVPGIFGGTPVLFLFLAGLMIPMGIHTELSTGLFSLAGRPKWRYRVGLVTSITQIALIGILVTTGALTAGTALVSTVAATAAAWLVSFWPLRRLRLWSIASDLQLLRETLKASLLLHVGALLLFLHLRLDMFMVKAWLGTEALGLYSVSVILAETLPLATESIALAILPGQVTASLEAAAARSIRVSHAVVAFGLALAVGWVVAGSVLIRVVFGSSFLPAYVPLLVLLPGMVLLGIQRVCGAPTLRAGRPGLIAGISLISLVCNALLNVIWIPRWGLSGASAASTVSYCLSSALFMGWTLKLGRLTLRDALVPRREDWTKLALVLRDRFALNRRSVRPSVVESRTPLHSATGTASRADKPIRVMRLIARLNVGGPARQALILSKGLAHAGFESLLVHGSVGRDEAGLDSFVSAESINRVHIASFGRPLSALDDLAAFREILRLIWTWHPDIVHTHTAKAGALGRLAAGVCNLFRSKSRRSVVVHTFHGHVFTGYFGAAGSLAVRTAERCLALMTDRIIAISDRQRADLVTRFKVATASQVAVVPLGLELDELLARDVRDRGIRQSLGFASDDRVVGYVGRLVPIKRVDTLIRGIAAARKRIPRIRLMIVGDGEMRLPLEHLVDELGLGASVRFVGWRGDLRDVYAAMDAFVLTSANEGTPVSLIEAMAAGVPVVATNVGGVPDVVRDGLTGTLIPSGQPDAVASAVCAIFTDAASAEAMAAAARRDVSSKFGADRLLEDMSSLYRTLLFTKRGAAGSPLVAVRSESARRS